MRGGSSPVPDGSVKVVLAWVGDDQARASSALDVEHADESPRKTLIKSLEKVVSGSA